MKKLMLIIFSLVLIVMSSAVVWSEGLTADDINFLKNKCLVEQSDIDVIPKLAPEVTNNLYSLIAKRDCDLLKPFKVSRKYFRDNMSTCEFNDLMSPEGWSSTYLTKEERAQLNKHIRSCF
jgi:hypothetical protein